MISYGFSIQGKSHITKEKVCQDANIICKLKKNWILAAVADGVGSAMHSEIGSQIAVEKVSEYCSKHFPQKATTQKIINVLKEGYQYAFECILEYCKKNGGIISDYDTTLSTVIYNGRTVVFGHSGDGGIIVRKESGEYKTITDRQKGIDGISVIPLRGGEDSWVFGIYEDTATSVLLATDGILDGVLMPYLLNVDGVNTMEEILEGKKDKVYVTSAELLMNPKCVFKNKTISNPEEFVKNFIEDSEKAPDRGTITGCIRNGYEGYFGKKVANKIAQNVDKYGYTKWSIQKVTDDKTIVCLINDKTKTVHMPEDYYMEPDWEDLQHRYERILYPAMHQQKEDISTKETGNDKKVSKAGVGNKKKRSGKERKNKRKLKVKVLPVILVAAIFLGVTFAGVQLGKYIVNKRSEKSEVTTMTVEESEAAVEETTIKEEATTTEKTTTEEETTTIEETTTDAETTTEKEKATEVTRSVEEL